MTLRPGRDEAGISLIEVMISSILMLVCIMAVDTTMTVFQAHQVQVNEHTQSLDYLQVAQEAITRDLHAAVTWTTPAVPTSMPSQAVTATTLAFTASLGGGTPTINIGLNTSTHALTVTCTGVGCRTGATSSTVVTQAQAQNIDSSSLFTLTTNEVSTINNSVTTNSFYYTDVASNLVLDLPSTTAAHPLKTTIADPDIVVNTVEYSCETALNSTGATGSC